MGHGVPEAAWVLLQRLERAQQSSLWITASEDGASATCVGVAPACKELRSGPNKSEREPTSARSTNCGSGHLIPAFHGTGRTFSLLPSHPLDAASCSIDAPLVSCRRPLGLVLERQSSQAKDGFVKKGFNCVLCGAHRAGDERGRASFTKREPRPKRLIQKDETRHACLAFAAGFVLDRLAIRRGRFDAAKSKKEQ